MNADLLQRLVVLAEIADAGGLTAAARRLGLAKSSVSHQIAQLERTFGARVLERHGRGVVLTPVGEALAVHGRGIRQEAAAAVSAARQFEEPRGVLRIGMPGGIGDALLVPMLAAFLARFPGIALETAATDVVVDLEKERLDLAFRIGAVSDGRFVARKLLTADDLLVAAPAYLAVTPPIAVPADLAGHAWIGFSAFGARQVVDVECPDGTRQEVTVTCRVSTTSGISIRQWLLAGAGVARLPDFTVRDDLDAGRLVRVLPGHVVGRPSLHVVYMPERFRPANVRRLIDHARAFFARP